MSSQNNAFLNSDDSDNDTDSFVHIQHPQDHSIDPQSVALHPHPSLLNPMHQPPQHYVYQNEQQRDIQDAASDRNSNMHLLMDCKVHEPRTSSPPSLNQFQPTSQTQQLPPSQMTNPPAGPQGTPMAQNPNMNFMALMQDPNFMQQMAAFMKQMQLLQQNETVQNSQHIPSHSPSNVQSGNPLANLSTVASSHSPNVLSSLHSNSGPRKELNILVLAESEIEKSSWIDGIANYMSFDTINQALDAPEPVSINPKKFKIDDFKEHKDASGHVDIETFFRRLRAKPDARTYMFQTPKYDVHFIVTPGIADVCEINQDREYTQMILNVIAQYKNLHAICFLVESQGARISDNFRYCINDLLLLHQEAADNFVFFFNKSPPPVEAIVNLQDILEELCEINKIEIPFDQKNIFCLDNEAFKFVSAYHNGTSFYEKDILLFASSWKRSAEEAFRFLDFASECKPHPVEKILSINQAYDIILQLSKSMNDINDSIATKIKMCNDQKSEVENITAAVDELKTKLLTPQIYIKIEQLPYPMVVCCDKKCIETQRIPHTQHSQVNYKQVCVEHCHVPSVTPEVVPDPQIRPIIGENCRECGCHWSHHMITRFKQVLTNENVEDVNIKNAIQTKEDTRIKMQKNNESCENLLDAYKQERKIVMDTILRLSVFVKQTAILVSIKNNVEESTEAEEKCIITGKKLSDEYRQERAAAIRDIVHANVHQQITTEDIKQIKSQLFALPYFGAKIEVFLTGYKDTYEFNQQKSSSSKF